MASLRELGRKVAAIEQRNKKVGEDKAWETSYTRKAILALLWLGYGAQKLRDLLGGHPFRRHATFPKGKNLTPSPAVSVRIASS